MIPDNSDSLTFPLKSIYYIYQKSISRISGQGPSNPLSHFPSPTNSEGFGLVFDFHNGMEIAGFKYMTFFCTKATLVYCQWCFKLLSFNDFLL